MTDASGSAMTAGSASPARPPAPATCVPHVSVRRFLDGERVVTRDLEQQGATSAIFPRTGCGLVAARGRFEPVERAGQRNTPAPRVTARGINTTAVRRSPDHELLARTAVRIPGSVARFPASAAVPRASRSLILVSITLAL